MSQYQQMNAKGQTVVYGFNPTSGYCIQVQDPTGQVILHRWSQEDGLTGSELVGLAEENGVTLPEEHVLCAMLDLPLETWSPLLVGQ